MDSSRVCITGMGYVGVTLAVALAGKDFDVIGVEIQPHLVERLQQGKVHFHEVGLEREFRRYLGKRLHIVSEMPPEPYPVYVIAVATPLDPSTKLPIVDHVVRAARQIAMHAGNECLVVLRSTLPVGTSRSVVLPILQRARRKVWLAFCPERTAEGNALEELRYLPQVVGGLDQESTERAMHMFIRITPTVIEVSSLEAAETIKLVNNAYRDLQFAFANEVGLICEKLNLDAVEVARAASTGYPRTQLHRPGFVGGACLTKDPYILIESLRPTGFCPPLISEARRINEATPRLVAEEVCRDLERLGRTNGECKIFITGIAFKGQSETDDIRGSQAVVLAEDLRQRLNASFFGHDFVVPGEALQSIGFRAVSIEEGFEHADVAIIANNHPRYRELDFPSLLCRMKKPGIFFDVWSVCDPPSVAEIPNVIYRALGRGEIPQTLYKALGHD